MKKLKKPTVGMLMATLVFSNISLAPIYANKVDTVDKNISKQIVQNYDISTKDENKSSKANEIINIPDINLKQSINSNLGKEEDSDITRDELENIDSLEIIRNIENLEGIQYCVNLESLYIEMNNISDISLLSGLTKMKTLNLGSNNISDISALSGLINLEHLHLDNNNISDISSLSELINLKSLSLDNNNISNISNLSELINLKFLSLDHNNISDITPLSSLINLNTLYLIYNNISDISTLSELTKIEDLVLYGNNISNISSLSGLINVRNLDLYDNNISDITPLLNININKDELPCYVYLNKNHLNLNDSKTMEVINYLKSIGCEVNYENQLTTNVFNDIKGHWAEEAIKSFTDKGFINGYEDGTFRPDDRMRRAEFVKVVNRVFGYTEMGLEEFNDVNENDWYYEDICIGIKEGYINGKSKDTFAPNDNITRQEVAIILTNIMKNKDESLDKLNTFKDGNETDKWAQAAVEGAIEAGYLNGYEDKTIRANGDITRAEAISMLSRVKNNIN